MRQKKVATVQAAMDGVEYRIEKTTTGGASSRPSASHAMLPEKSNACQQIPMRRRHERRKEAVLVLLVLLSTTLDNVVSRGPGDSFLCVRLTEINSAYIQHTRSVLAPLSG